MKDCEYVSLLNIQELPFFYGLLNEAEIKDPILPQFMRFKWGVNLRYSLFCQFPDTGVARAVSQAYHSSATIAPPAGQGEVSERWASTILKVINEFFPASVRGKKVLEIGCSNGLLLSKFASNGALCDGIEPGPQAELCRLQDGITIHRCYFEEYEHIEKYDLVYAVNVLEHIAELDLFFSKLSRLLRPDGLFICAVPNSILEIQALSPNIFVHEHYWYFTPETLLGLLKRFGFSDVKYLMSPFGSNMFLCGRFAGFAEEAQSDSDREVINKKIIDIGKVFADKLSTLIIGLQGRIDRVSKAEGGKIGLYGASNAVNFFGLLDWKICPKIFDTDRVNQGKYLWSKQYHQIIVESPSLESLISLSEIWILPIAHQVDIKNYLLEMGVPNTKLFLYSELCGNGLGYQSVETV